MGENTVRRRDFGSRYIRKKRLIRPAAGAAKPHETIAKDHIATFCAGGAVTSDKEVFTMANVAPLSRMLAGRNVSAA